MVHKRKMRRKKLYLAVIIGCSIVIILLLLQREAPEKVPPTVNQQATPETSQTAVTSEAVNRGLPAKLVIPKLNISAKVTYVGLTKNGDMAAPGTIHDVGWYKYGALPGNKGSAVLAGHLNGLKGEPGIFTDLDKLQKNDTFSVIDTKNQTVHFMVREIRTYDQSDQPDEVFKASEAAHLNLITCTGTWDREQRHFTKRLVVFADQVAEPS